MSKTILYVEDNPQNLRLVRKMLRIGGYEMLEANTGELGIELAIQNLPDLILMDINLPDIDGIEATNRLKKMKETANIPVVALTANAMYGDRERFLEGGCDGYIAKPVSKNELLHVLHRFLD